MLHLTWERHSVQIAFGWENFHLHAVKINVRRYGTEWTGQRHYLDDGNEAVTGGNWC